MSTSTGARLDTSASVASVFSFGRMGWMQVRIPHQRVTVGILFACRLVAALRRNIHDYWLSLSRSVRALAIQLCYAPVYGSSTRRAEP